LEISTPFLVLATMAVIYKSLRPFCGETLEDRRWISTAIWSGLFPQKLNALNFMLQKEGDIPQNVNFAIKASVAATFLQSNGVKFASGESVQPMEPPDLADVARALSVFVMFR
jgi:hypothetical protein